MLFKKDLPENNITVDILQIVGYIIQYGFKKKIVVVLEEN